MYMCFIPAPPFDLIQVQEDNGKDHLKDVSCLPSRMTWAMLSVLLSPGSSKLHLKISGYKADMVRSMQWRIPDIQTVVWRCVFQIFFVHPCPVRCLQRLLELRCTILAWRISSKGLGEDIYKIISTKHDPGSTVTGNAQKGMHAKVQRFQFTRLVICRKEWPPFYWQKVGCVCFFRFGISSFLSTKLSWRQVRLSQKLGLFLGFVSCWTNLVNPQLSWHQLITNESP